MTVMSRLLVAGAAVIAASGLVTGDSWSGESMSGHHGHLMVHPPAFIPVASDPTLPRTGWTVTADSQQSTHPATAAIDGNTTTMWHTRSPVAELVMLIVAHRVCAAAGGPDTSRPVPNTSAAATAQKR